VKTPNVATSQSIYDSMQIKLYSLLEAMDGLNPSPRRKQV